MRMNIQPIEIKIKDNWKFCEIAFLVDRDDFLRDLVRARKKLGVTKLIPYKELSLWENKELDRGLAANPIKPARGSYGSKLYIFPYTKSDTIIEKLRRKYHKAINFTLVINTAILTGLVTNSEFSKSAYSRVLYPEDYAGEPQIAIIIMPDTNPKEVADLFKTEIPSVVKEYKDIVLKTKRRTPDTISNIKRDREWYWQKRSGLSYSKIVSLAEPMVSKDVVIKAIKQYESRLSMEL